MLPPESVITQPLAFQTTDSIQQVSINHPANLGSILSHLAEEMNLDRDELQSQFTDNFSRFFLANHP
jgi:Tat protein secretion system quality control protein TatD with DNase activity